MWQQYFEWRWSTFRGVIDDDAGNLDPSTGTVRLPIANWWWLWSMMLSSSMLLEHNIVTMWLRFLHRCNAINLCERSSHNDRWYVFMSVCTCQHLTNFLTRIRKEWFLPTEKSIVTKPTSFKAYIFLLTIVNVSRISQWRSKHLLPQWLLRTYFSLNPRFKVAVSGSQRNTYNCVYFYETKHQQHG